MEVRKSMEARVLRAAWLAAVLFVSMGARYRTPNFIVDNPDPAFARQSAEAAEKYRRELAVEWLGKQMPNWSRPCLITVRDGPQLGAGGATTFVFDRGEVFGWRMTVQGSRQRLLDSVLPHEVTHTIFASHFRRPLPRWADEGGATSVEHASERAKHYKMLHQFLRTGRGIAFSRMFAMKNYPRDIMPLYAQGYSLADFLIQLGGRRKYIEFVGDGMDTGDWPGAISRHYRIAGAKALQDTWLAWVRKGSPPLKSRPGRPAAVPAPEQLASNTPSKSPAAPGRRLRPEPNLIYRIPKKESSGSSPRKLVPVSMPPRSSPYLAGPPSQVAAAGVRRSPKQLPSSGWHAIGSNPPRSYATAVANPSRCRPGSCAAPLLPPLRSQLTRPQPLQPPRQIILPSGGG